jgi:hypothetical protein
MGYNKKERKHPLFVGERVFELGQFLIGTIVDIKGSTVYLEMTPYDEQENKKWFDCEITEEEMKWESEEEYVYQFAEGLVGRDGNPVCYEHNPTETDDDDYPYYSPYLNENLYGTEVSTEQAQNKVGEKAYGLMVMLGTIIDEMKKGEESVTLEELEELYDMATEINEHFNG